VLIIGTLIVTMSESERVFSKCSEPSRALSYERRARAHLLRRPNDSLGSLAEIAEICEVK